MRGNTAPLCVSVSWFDTINLKPNSRPRVLTANTGRLFEAETITQKIGAIIFSQPSFSTCRYKLVELLGYVAMGAVPAAVILSMVSTKHKGLSVV